MDKIIRKLRENKSNFLQKQILESNREKLMRNCDNHLPILISYNKNTFIGDLHEQYYKPYIRCMCCGLDMSFMHEDIVFDVSDIELFFDNTIENLNLKYYFYVERYAEILEVSDTMEEANERFEEFLGKQKIRRR